MQRSTRNVAVALVAGCALLATAAAGLGASGHQHSTGGASKLERKLAGPVARVRAATAKYANDLEAAEADGYRIITRMIPDMGYHFLNPSIGEFRLDQPPVLVYVRDGDDWQLAAVEWVFPEKPDRKPIPGARYGSFEAACHYDDGTFVFASSEADCPETSPETDTPFVFWHPDLVTLHFWVWYPNPDGVFNGTNRWVRPFNDEML